MGEIFNIGRITSLKKFYYKSRTIVLFDYYLRVLRNYAKFTGRARRKEYWMFMLFNAIVITVLSIIDHIAFGLDILYTLYAFVTLVPTLALHWRRVHDTSRSGWWMLLMFVPILGWAILFVFTLLPSTPGANKYGDDPTTLPDPA